MVALRLFPGRGAVAALLFGLLLATGASGEDRTYGEVWLTGLASDSWPLNPIGVSAAMVCNVNGPDGFLTVRAGPDTSFPKVRAFNRLAILEVDTGQRQGRWIRVLHGYRQVTKDGVGQPLKELPVRGWAHDGYLCDFIH